MLLPLSSPRFYWVLVLAPCWLPYPNCTVILPPRCGCCYGDRRLFLGCRTLWLLIDCPISFRRWPIGAGDYMVTLPVSGTTNGLRSICAGLCSRCSFASGYCRLAQCCWIDRMGSWRYMRRKYAGNYCRLASCGICSTANDWCNSIGNRGCVTGGCGFCRLAADAAARTDVRTMATRRHACCALCYLRYDHLILILISRLQRGVFRGIQKGGESARPKDDSPTRREPVRQ